MFHRLWAVSQNNRSRSSSTRKSNLLHTTSTSRRRTLPAIRRNKCSSASRKICHLGGIFPCLLCRARSVTHGRDAHPTIHVTHRTKKQSRVDDNILAGGERKPKRSGSGVRNKQRPPLASGTAARLPFFISPGEGFECVSGMCTTLHVLEKISLHIRCTAQSGRNLQKVNTPLSGTHPLQK